MLDSGFNPKKKAICRVIGYAQTKLFGNIYKIKLRKKGIKIYITLKHSAI